MGEVTTIAISGETVEETTTIESAVDSILLPSTVQTETREEISVDTTDYTELLAYQNDRLTEISTLLTYILVTGIIVIAVSVCKWISSVINAV
ncbi:MAG: hypothetical protein IJY83_01010 [Oscillospiraceae bacterium]|nr:hypothetical protein [Oscillospiraceae bacterium]